MITFVVTVIISMVLCIACCVVSFLKSGTTFGAAEENPAENQPEKPPEPQKKDPEKGERDPLMVPIKKRCRCRCRTPSILALGIFVFLYGLNIFHIAASAPVPACQEVGISDSSSTLMHVATASIVFELLFLVCDMISMVTLSILPLIISMILDIAGIALLFNAPCGATGIRITSAVLSGIMLGFVACLGVMIKKMLREDQTRLLMMEVQLFLGEIANRFA